MFQEDSIEFLPNYLAFYILRVNMDILKDSYNYCKNVFSQNGDNKKQLKKGDYIVIETKQENIYIVKPVDTFEKISKEFGVSIEYIKNKNKIESLFIGQQLII